MLTYYILSLGIVPFLASRAIIPIFATALVARFGPEWDWLADMAGIQLVSDLPLWMTDNRALLILGLGALVELIAQKSQDLRNTFNLTEPVIKGLLAFFLCFNLVEGDFNELIRIIMEEGPTSNFVWGNSFAYTWSFGIGWAVYWVTTIRAGIYNFLQEMDEDDDLGLQGILSWLEDGIGFVGIIFAVLLPTLALFMAGISVLGLWLFLRYIRYREEKAKVPCKHCNHPNHRCGTQCASCNEALAPVFQVGILGIIRKEIVTDLDEHRLNMISRKRCHSCGERFKENRANQTCSVCGTAPFRHRGDMNRYLERMSGLLPKTLLISAAIGIVPLFGLAPGIIYYRINLISGMRCYIPIAGGCLTRWFVRILNLILICLQIIPIVGMFTLPLMCFTNYVVYKSVFKTHATNVLPANAASVPS